MKFLVDAHLPKRLARILQQLGHDAIHTLDLPEQNRTPDETIIAVAIAEGRTRHFAAHFAGAHFAV